MKTKFLLPLVLVCSLFISVNAQEVYRTISGDIAISVTHHDSTLLLVSNNLLVTLDYETSKVYFRVALETFHTGVDSFDSRLKALRDTVIEFTGRLGITISSNRFDPQKTNMEGIITSIHPTVTVRGNGSMTCLPAGDNMTPACTLLLNMEAPLTVLHLAHVFPGSGETARIDLRQSILEKQKQ